MMRSNTRSLESCCDRVCASLVSRSHTGTSHGCTSQNESQMKKGGSSALAQISAPLCALLWQHVVVWGTKDPCG